MFNLNGLYEMLGMMMFLILGFILTVLKLCGVLLTGWWIVGVCVVIAIVLLIKGSMQ